MKLTSEFLFFLLSLIFSCVNSDQIPTSLISTYKDIVPTYCHNSYETIHCFEHCNLDNQANCKNLCETDPIYWLCVWHCNDHTELWGRCFTETQSPCNQSDVSQGICPNCLINATFDHLKFSCDIAHLPGEEQEDYNLCEQLSDCGTESDDRPQNIPDLIHLCIADNKEEEKARDCVNTYIMHSQRKCCYSEVMRNASMCRNDMYKCDQACSNILTPAKCKVKCDRFRNEKIQACVDECDGDETCEIETCQQTGNSPFCNPVVDDSTVQLLDFANCNWQVDFVKSDNPYFLWATYFNELTPREVKHKLKHPDTTRILMKTSYNGKRSFFSFPYFLVIRSKCEEGNYDSGAYRLIMSGADPSIQMMYKAPPTSRHLPNGFISATLETALISLNRLTNDTLIPENARSINNSDATGCHERICYPAFVAPLIYLNIPRFEIIINAEEGYNQEFHTIYVSPYHSRTVDGKGDIQVADSLYPTHAGALFPKERATFSVDMELSKHFSCYANDITNQSDPEYQNRTCPELEHILDSTDTPYNPNPFIPLDAEDNFRSQYTHGTSPVQAIAGFYDPRFLIIGDADMSKFEIVNWGNLLKTLERNSRFNSCISQEYFQRGFEKPIYSFLDRTDEKYPINYYRQRYFARAYYTAAETVEEGIKNNSTIDYAETAIFEAISLEDRLLLVTTKGLVSFYGHTNATASANKAWWFNESEIVNRCFKFVRILPKVQQHSDTIVGVTYSCNMSSNDNKLHKREQEVWLGKYTLAGQDIIWKEIKTNVTLDPKKMKADTEDLTPSEKVFKLKPKSEIEVICYKAFVTKMNISKMDDVRTNHNQAGWCEAIDATPLQLRPNMVQILIRMQVVLYSEGQNVRSLYFYILASNRVGKGVVAKVGWRIDAVIPRIPCIHPQRESVINVYAFDEYYFKKVGSGHEGSGCHDNEGRIPYNVYLSGLTYSRTFTNHLFLYGSRLIQSTNRGGSFIYLKDFPSELGDWNAWEAGTGKVHRQVHRITKMAFDDGGHYAFLTNKRELWLGSLGTLHQIRLRPSPWWSMSQLGVSKVKNLYDGVAFNIDFDSGKRLYEMVAIQDDYGMISKVMKRHVDHWKLLRVKRVLEKLQEQSSLLVKTRNVSTEAQIPALKAFNYNPVEWSSMCSYLSPIIFQNFSSQDDRTQRMIFPRPHQHLLLGIPHTEGSLMAFQASTFLLVWNTAFLIPNRLYAGMDSDPFIDWVRRKKSESVLSLAKYTKGEPTPEDAILVEPRKFKRVFLDNEHSKFLKFYFLDYNIVAETRIEFALKSDYQTFDPDFTVEEINSVQLNIENSNGSIIQINTEKEIVANRAAVVFLIRMTVKRKAGLKQSLPGWNAIPVPVTYHLIGAFGKCLENSAKVVLGDRIDTVAVAGCPASRDLVFDWNRTLASLMFRGERSGQIVEHGVGELCYNGEFICFFSRSSMVLFFQVFDEAKQVYLPYTGNYIMRLIAGGSDRDNLRNFTKAEIEAFNIPGVSDVSLIWNEWDPIKHEKKDWSADAIRDDSGNEVKRDNRETILQSGNSTIIWACRTLSPCARIMPRPSLEAVFWFKVFITNKDVDNNTLCLYEKTFDILLYGFPPSPEIQLLSTLGFSLFILSLLYLSFICCRRHGRLWIQTKSTAKNWVHIVKDAIPKKLRFYEPPLPEEQAGRRHSRKHFGSTGSPDHSYTSLEGSFENISEHNNASSSTIDSMSAGRATSSQIIPKSSPFGFTSGKKSVVYDQLLTRRLNSIVEKNRTMRTNLLRKASIKMKKSELENEENFQQRFGRTVSQESFFAPPMPKDNRGYVEFF